MEVKECPGCGVLALKLIARPGRVTFYKEKLIEIPADFEIPECTECGCMPIIWSRAKELTLMLESAYQKKTSRFEHNQLRLEAWLVR